MVASESDSGDGSRLDDIRRRIEKSAKPTTPYDPSNPHDGYDRMQLEVELKAKNYGLTYFLNCPPRPVELPRSMRSSSKASKSGEDEATGLPTLEKLQTTYDSGNAVFFDLVHKHIAISTDAMALKIKREFAATQDGVKYWEWLHKRGSRDTPMRQKLLRQSVNNFKLSAQACTSAQTIDDAVSKFFTDWCLIKNNDESDPEKLSDAIDLVLDAFPAEHDCSSIVQTLQAQNASPNSDRWPTFDAFQRELFLHLEKFMKRGREASESMLPLQEDEERRKRKASDNPGIPGEHEVPDVMQPAWSGSGVRPRNMCDTCTIRGCCAKNWQTCFSNPANDVKKLPLIAPTKRYVYGIELLQFAARKMGKTNMRGIDVPRAMREEFKKVKASGETITACLGEQTAMSDAEIWAFAEELMRDDEQCFVLTASWFGEQSEDEDEICPEIRPEIRSADEPVAGKPDVTPLAVMRRAAMHDATSVKQVRHRSAQASNPMPAAGGADYGSDQRGDDESGGAESGSKLSFLEEKPAAPVMRVASAKQAPAVSDIADLLNLGGMAFTPAFTPKSSGGPKPKKLVHHFAAMSGGSGDEADTDDMEFERRSPEAREAVMALMSLADKFDDLDLKKEETAKGDEDSDRTFEPLREFLSNTGVAASQQGATLRALRDAGCETVDDISIMIDHEKLEDCVPPVVAIKLRRALAQPEKPPKSSGGRIQMVAAAVFVAVGIGIGLISNSLMGEE